MYYLSNVTSCSYVLNIHHHLICVRSPGSLSATQPPNVTFSSCLQDYSKMNVGVAHSEPNPNTSYFNSRGIWLTYVIVVVILHYVCLSLPFLTVGMAWTLTSLLHNLVRMQSSGCVQHLTTSWFTFCVKL